MATSSNAHEVARRGRPPKTLADSAPRRFRLDFLDIFSPALRAASGIQFPNPYYQDNPAAFAREILGVEPWEKQIEILEAVRDHQRVAVKSGHKVGKSHSAAVLALWYFCSFEDARVVMSSTTARQVDAILWRELRMLHARSGCCVDCKRLEKRDKIRISRPCPHSSLIQGDMAETARSGMKCEFREIVGFTAKQAEAVAGVSGINVLYLLDEASGIAQMIFDAIEGNRAGNARVAMFSNPTQNAGQFYDAFNAKARFYKTITVSSYDTPNYKTGRAIIPGLATREWVEEKREEWGENSPLFTVRVKGEFAEHEQGKIFSIHTIEQAEQRYSETPSEGRLYIGIDPAGETGTGDEAAFAVRRGLKAIQLATHRALSSEGHLIQLLMLINVHKLPRETPVVVLDYGGSVGVDVYKTLRAYLADHPGAFELVRVASSDRSLRQPDVYDRMRDALTASLAAWFEQGGAIPEDAKLAKELHQMEWKQRADGRQKVTDKIALRKLLGRSPDRYDALALSCWEPLSLREQATSSAEIAARAAAQRAARPMDPYAGARAWEKR